MIPRPNTSVLLHQLVHLSICSTQSLIGPLFTHTFAAHGRSLQNKVFPQKREFLSLGILQWCRQNGLPSMPKSTIQVLGSELWSSHLSHLTNHITRSSIKQLEQLFPGAVFHCEDKHASSLRIFCPCLYHQAIEKTFLDPEAFAPIPHTPQYITSTLVDHLLHKYGRSPILRLSAKAVNFRPATSWPKRRRTSPADVQSFLLWMLLFDRC